MQTPPSSFTNWITQSLGEDNWQIETLKGDASSRRYYRIWHDAKTMIAMFDPPPKSTLSRYIQINQWLDATGISVPKLFYNNTADGMLLQEDLGDATLLKTLNKTNTISLYTHALDQLKTLQQAKAPNWINSLNKAQWRDEMALFDSWFCTKHCNKPLKQDELTTLSTITDSICEAIEAQPQVLVHRDYHSRNLMWHQNTLYWIDFQDMFKGPICYDIISLLQDYYHCLNPQEAQALMQQAHRTLIPDVSTAQFTHWADKTATQRHLKNLGNFARLIHLYNKPQFANDITQIVDYLMQICERHDTLKPLIPMIQHRMEST